MKWIALVCVTPLFCALSLSKLVPDVTSSFLPRDGMAWTRGCVCVCVRKTERTRESERYDGVGKRQRWANGFLWPQMEMGMWPNDFIPTSVSHPSISPGLQSQNTSSQAHTNCGYSFILTNAVLLYMPAHVSLHTAPITLGYVQFSLTYLTETQEKKSGLLLPCIFQVFCFIFIVLQLLCHFCLMCFFYFVLVH